MPEINEVYRRIRNVPYYFKQDGSISSAIYKDRKGVSVDIDDNRPIEEIIKSEEELHKYYNQQRLIEEPEGEYKLIALGSVSSNICEVIQVRIELDPIKNINPYHAILKRSSDSIELTKSQAKKLAKNTKIVKTYFSAFSECSY